HVAQDDRDVGAVRGELIGRLPEILRKACPHPLVGRVVDEPVGRLLPDRRRLPVLRCGRSGRRAADLLTCWRGSRYRVPRGEVAEPAEGRDPLAVGDASSWFLVGAPVSTGR